MRRLDGTSLRGAFLASGTSTRSERSGRLRDKRKASRPKPLSVATGPSDRYTAHMDRSMRVRDAYRVFMWVLAVRLAFSGAGLLFYVIVLKPLSYFTLYFVFPTALLTVLGLIPWFRRSISDHYLAVLLSADVLILSAHFLPSNLLRMALGAEEAGRLMGAYMFEPFVLLLIPVVLMAWAFGRRGALWGGTLASAARFTGMGWLFKVFGLQSVSLAGFMGQTLFLYAIPLIVAELAQRERQQLDDLGEAHERLSRHAATVEQLAISRERNRMARDLHDTLAHTLAGLAVHLEALRTTLTFDPGSAQQSADDAVKMARMGLEESRQAIQALREDPVTTLGLIGALTAALGAFQERTGIETHLTLGGTEPELTEFEARTLVRIFEEALSNVERHASSENVWVRLSDGIDRLELTIRDDGVGFDVRNVEPGHYGLTGMRERAHLMHADLRIISQAPRGTEVWCVLER